MQTGPGVVVAPGGSVLSASGLTSSAASYGINIVGPSTPAFSTRITRMVRITESTFFVFILIIRTIRVIRVQNAGG